jgi:hypothetical protein
MRKLLAILLLSFVVCVPAAEKKPLVNAPAPTHLNVLFKEAIALGGYTDFCAKRFWGCPMPDVTIHLTDENIRGHFSFEHPTRIYLNNQYDAPGTLLWNEVAIHEFTHYLQWLSGKYSPARADICEMMFEIERDAYNVGHSYLKKHGVVADTAYFIEMLKMNYAMCTAAVVGG